MSIGARRHLVRLDTPDTPVADGQGGYTQAWTLLGTAYAEIQPATTATLERLGANTVAAMASHTIRIPWRSGVTTTTRVTLGAREFAITGLANPDEKNVDLVLVCTERVT